MGDFEKSSRVTGGVGCGCSQTSRPGRVAMVLEKMKHDRGKGPVGMSYGSECSREVLMALGIAGDHDESIKDKKPP